ncbi:hypothetical protein [Altibacter sp.]|uniref:hypothetical protein n=1 Tax=Altibacter sp. TaxID=2024823 RepID=UPI0025BA3D51|nr:hypothetical protein [Altibacter sp.]|tara:strand:+ start:1561 stop:1713 length:153 start_codon:yes stop_codon:yes gene_type:complete
MAKQVKFIEANYLDELENKVNPLLRVGWKIEGNLVTQNDAFYITLSQELK